MSDCDIFPTTIDCCLCDAQAADWGSLRQHYAVHVTGPPYICELCQKECAPKNNYVTHLLSHSKVTTARISDEDSSTETEPLLEGAPRQQWGRVCVRVYRADGLPRLDAGILAQVKKRCSVDACGLVDPYVQVSFGGIQGCTSKRKRTPAPAWNEQLSFTFPFPLPNDPLVLRVRDDDFVAGGVIGTTLVRIDKISNPRNDGFLPTFGPCFVYLRDKKELESKEDADPSYKGRLLMAVHTEMSTESHFSKPFVQLESIPALTEGSYGFEEEFLLFACIQEASMIDRKVGEDIRFTLQMGEMGRDPRERGEESTCASPSMKPVPINSVYMQASFGENMPCVWLKGKWPDNRKRMYASNLLHKMARTLRDTLKNIRKPENTTASADKEQNKKCLMDLENVARTYLKILKECFESYAARTQLDNERLRIYQSDMEDIVQVSMTARSATNKTMLESALDKLNRLKRTMKWLADDPQCMLPDVVVWLESGSRRIAFSRIPARWLLFAVRGHERGVHSATTADFFLEPTAKTQRDTFLTRVKCYFWLGLTKNMKHCFENLPAGFTKIYATVHEEDSEAVPRTLSYFEKHFLRLRAHLHQARSLPSLDHGHPPDCFARVLIGDRSHTTQRKSKLLGRTIVGSIQVNNNFQNPPTLQWFRIHRSGDETDGQLLAAFELSRDQEHAADAENEAGDVGMPHGGTVMPIPPEIRPRFSMHRIEILFWGLRELRRVHWRHVTRPRVDVECAGQLVQSSVMADHRRHPNFVNMVACLDMDLPDESSYLPSLVLKLTETRSFGRESVVATHVVHSLHTYAFTPRQESNNRFSAVHIAEFGDARQVESRPSFVRSSNVVVNIDDIGIDVPPTAFLNQIAVSFPWKNEHRGSVIDAQVTNDEEEEEVELDWWSRYYISTNQWPAAQEENVLTGASSALSAAPSRKNAVPRSSLPRASMVGLRAFRDAAASMEARMAQVAEKTGTREAVGFVVYPCELESVPEFNGFQEWLHSLQLTRGKKFKRNAPREKVVAIFKGCFRIYRTPLPPMAADDLLPTPDGREGLFGGVPENTPTRVLVRAYVIKAVNLTATDVTNTSDPYIVLKLGGRRLSDRENYVSKQLNPFFGKCFEFAATFPADAILHAQVFDWDLVGSDDLIGVTTIDLENRFYSRHRPACGIPRLYETSGPNAWRDALKPTELLSKLCRDERLDGPHAAGRAAIRIGEDLYDFGEGFGDGAVGAENMALCLLHRWSEISPGKYPLTPEHVETRTLYHPKKTGRITGPAVDVVGPVRRERRAANTSQRCIPQEAGEFRASRHHLEYGRSDAG